MASELTQGLASYRLLYLQPDPEDGERAVVGILVYRERILDVIYDKKFPKLRCLAPGIEPELVGFYLENLKNTLAAIDSNIDQRLMRYGPQLLASEERKLAWPLSDTARLYLIERFLQP